MRWSTYHRGIIRDIAMLRIATPAMITRMGHQRATVQQVSDQLATQGYIGRGTIPEEVRQRARSWIGEATDYLVARPRLLELVHGIRDTMWDHDRIWSDAPDQVLGHTLAVSAWIGATIAALRTVAPQWTLWRIDRERMIGQNRLRGQVRHPTDRWIGAMRPDAILWWISAHGQRVGIVSEIDLESEDRGRWLLKIANYRSWLHTMAQARVPWRIIPVVVTRTVARWNAIARWWCHEVTVPQWWPWGATMYLALERTPPHYWYAGAPAHEPMSIATWVTEEQHRMVRV